MESLLLIENTVKKDKLDLKDTYFSIPLSEDSRKYARFYWKGNLYKFFCPCFGLVRGSYIFTKPLKIPVFFPRRLGSLIIIYLDDMLIIGKSVEETLFYRDKVILLMQELGFCDKSGKLVMIPTQIIAFLDIEIDSKAMTISLTDEKIQKDITKCLNFYQNHHYPVWN